MLGRLATTVFVLQGGWEGAPSREVVLAAHSVWPVPRWCAPGEVSTSSVLLDLESLGVLAVERTVTDPVTHGKAWHCRIIHRSGPWLASHRERWEKNKG